MAAICNASDSGRSQKKNLGNGGRESRPPRISGCSRGADALLLDPGDVAIGRSVTGDLGRTLSALSAVFLRVLCVEKLEPQSSLRNR